MDVNDAIKKSLNSKNNNIAPPGWVYTSKDWFNLEFKNFFSRSWHFFCLSHELDKYGSFRNRNFYNKNYLVIRDKNGGLRAFINSCKHRGAPLTDQKCGRMKSLVCPYHKWGYNLEGKLLNALGIENIEDVVEYDLNMTSVKVEEEAGLVFINFSEKIIFHH
jgi:phenylpropionate dioxygenase-like ring-hydroxylating dioxygenase large terminal subunit